jgi:hypothetical protein
MRIFFNAQLGYTREEAHALLQHRTATAHSTLSRDGLRVKTPLELDSGLELEEATAQH